MIPAGLTDANIEFFAVNSILHSLQSGIRYQYPDMPESHLDFLENEFCKDSTGKATVAHLPESDQLRIYSICRFGGCNSTPDSSEGDCTDSNEYYDCGFRGSCKYEGIRCKQIAAKNGMISTRQLEIMKLVASGLFNKEIAGRLSISENTVANHLANIFDKIGDRSRVSIVSFVSERGIV